MRLFYNASEVQALGMSQSLGFVLRFGRRVMKHRARACGVPQLLWIARVHSASHLGVEFACAVMKSRVRREERKQRGSKQTFQCDVVAAQGNIQR